MAEKKILLTVALRQLFKVFRESHFVACGEAYCAWVLDGKRLLCKGSSFESFEGLDSSLESFRGLDSFLESFEGCPLEEALFGLCEGPKWADLLLGLSWPT